MTDFNPELISLGLASQPTVQEAFAEGIMPTIDGDFSFVVDRRPPGQEDAYIPAQEYVAYFSQRRIPIADSDHCQHAHDCAHVPSYQTMFAVPKFADVVQAAASQALSTPEGCERFTRSMDLLGDKMRVLDCGARAADYLFEARDFLVELIGMGTPNGDVAEREMLLYELWDSLQLGRYEREMQRAYRYCPPQVLGQRPA